MQLYLVKTLILLENVYHTGVLVHLRLWFIAASCPYQRLGLTCFNVKMTMCMWCGSPQGALFVWVKLLSTSTTQKSWIAWGTCCPKRLQVLRCPSIRVSDIFLHLSALGFGSFHKQSHFARTLIGLLHYHAADCFIHRKSAILCHLFCSSALFCVCLLAC